MYMRRSFVFGFILVLSIAVIGCAPRATGGQAAELAGTEKAVIDIPALVIEYDADGTPSIGGMPLAMMAPVLGLDPAMIDQLVLPAEQVAAFTDANIQHVQVDNATDGILLLVNGEPIPSLVWDDTTLANLAELLTATGISTMALEEILPLVRTAGIGLIATFPVAAGNEPIATVNVGEGSADAAAQAAQQSFLGSVSDAVPQLHLGVDYNDDGSWVVGGMSTDEWADTVEGVPWDSFNLSEVLLSDISDAGIETAFVATNVDGISLKINDMDLPYLSWKHGELTHVVRLAQQLGMLDMGENQDAMMGLIEQWLPAVQAADVKINVEFP